jgi:hypothetical protein
MKSLDDVQKKMSALYEQVESGAMELKQADSLANIAGKYLKAEQLKFAREVFCDGKLRAPIPSFPSAHQLTGQPPVKGSA